MSAQPHLFAPGPADGALTNRQQHALNLLRANPEGLRSIDLGRAIHLEYGCHTCQTIVACQYATSEGERVGKQLRARGLLVKRRASGRWQLLHPPLRPFDAFPEGF